MPVIDFVYYTIKQSGCEGDKVFIFLCLVPVLIRYPYPKADFSILAGLIEAGIQAEKISSMQLGYCAVLVHQLTGTTRHTAYLTILHQDD